MTVRVGRHNEPGAVYIGRGSRLGNPFKIGRDGNRAEVIEKYEAWFEEQIERRNGAVLAALKDLSQRAERGDLVLGCFCAPLACHGDVLKRYLECK